MKDREPYKHVGLCNRSPVKAFVGGLQKSGA